MLILIVIFSCNKDLSPIGGNDEQLHYTHYETPDGILMKLDSLKKTYTLDEEVKGKFTVVNNSDTNSIHIISASGPLAIFYMYDQDNQRINYQPRYRTGTYYDFYFNPSDTLGANLRWNHITYSNDHFSDLKAYSGKYLITVSYAGIPTSKIGKWITINDTGDPISAKLLYYFQDADTLRLDYIIRNRISENANLELKNESPIEVAFFYGPSTEKIFSHSPQVDFGKIELSGRSDKMIYSYKISKEDPMIRDMIGSYFCKISIECKSRTITAGSWISL
jgi:hypothetical protein